MSPQAAQCVIKAMGLIQEATPGCDVRTLRSLKLILFIASRVARRLDPAAEVPEAVYPWERPGVSNGNNGGSE